MACVCFLWLKNAAGRPEIGASESGQWCQKRDPRRLDTGLYYIQTSASVLFPTPTQGSDVRSSILEMLESCSLKSTRLDEFLINIVRFISTVFKQAWA